MNGINNLFNYKKIIIFIFSILMVLILLNGVSATNLTVDEVSAGSLGVKNYTDTTNKIPSYVTVNGKNSTTSSFLNTLTKTVVQVNQNNNNPINISNVNPPTNPSGSATGTMYKSEYISIANNIKTFITSNGRAPNYASSSIGNIRYESLFYMYTKIMDFYKTNDRLPNYVTVTNIVGISTGGVVIQPQDSTPPTVTVDLASGCYNTIKTVTITATDNIDPNPLLHYSLDNGCTWNSVVKTVTLNLSQGVTNLKFYAHDALGNVAATQSRSYTIDTTAPYVDVSCGSGVYSSAQSITLTVYDNLDIQPIVYYTLNGATPTTSSAKYTVPFNISTTKTLKFIAVDAAGNQSPIQTVYYIFSPVGNIDTGRGYSNIQSAINDSSTLDGHTIEVIGGTYNENMIINKKLTIKTASSADTVTIHAVNSSSPVFTILAGGSESLIQGFVITGAVNSYGILLNGCSNCTINSNTITNNYFGILTNTIKTENNTIINNNITLNQMLGLGTWNSDNCVIYGNTITYNGYGGITLFDSNNCIIHTNLIMDNNSPGNDSSGILISGSNNTIIQNNLIPGNMYGLYIDYCDNCTVYGNLITQGIVGIYADYSSADINFNRIASNINYELINEYGNVDATNNWWGSNSNPMNLGEILLNNGYVDYNPWLILGVDPVSVNSGGNASINADLTHNNLGEDTSSLGHVIKGIPITFSTNYGTITSSALTFNGQAEAILNLGTTESRTVTVSASLDNQTVSRQLVIASGTAALNITSKALNSTTNQPINITYNTSLNSSVTWISVLWRNTNIFNGELQIIVNGNVVNNTEYINPAYKTWKNSYRSDVFRAIIYANNYILQDGMDPEAIPASFWNDLKSLYSLTSAELQFIKNHRLEFIDNLTVNLSYPGADAPAMTVTDPETNNTIPLNFTGNTVHRTSPIMYLDGLSAGYEGVKSFAIATSKVNDNIAQYWAEQKNVYPVGGMKAAYGTFFTALMMIYCHDILADTATSEFDVTWTRTHPAAVSVSDDAYQTYLTLECDHSMGMTVIGSLKNTILFNSTCSSQISTIEYGIMRNLDFIYQYSTVSMDVMGSVAQDMFYAFWIGTDMELFSHNGWTVIKLIGRDDLILLYDPETGIMRDINTFNGFYGAYCFHDQITELSYDFFAGVKNNTSDYRDWVNEIVEDFSRWLNPPGMLYNWENEQHIAIGAGKIGIYLWASVVMGTFSGPYGAAGVLVGGYYHLFIGGMQEIQDYWNNPAWIPE